MHVHPIEKKADDVPGLRSVDCCLQTSVTNFKHCGSDAMRLIGCCICCLYLFSGYKQLKWYPPLLVVTSVHADAPIHILLSAIATLFMPSSSSVYSL